MGMGHNSSPPEMGTAGLNVFPLRAINFGVALFLSHDEQLSSLFEELGGFAPAVKSQGGQCWSHARKGEQII